MEFTEQELEIVGDAVDTLFSDMLNSDELLSATIFNKIYKDDTRNYAGCIEQLVVKLRKAKRAKLKLGVV